MTQDKSIAAKKRARITFSETQTETHKYGVTEFAEVYADGKIAGILFDRGGNRRSCEYSDFATKRRMHWYHISFAAVKEIIASDLPGYLIAAARIATEIGVKQ